MPPREDKPVSKAEPNRDPITGAPGAHPVGTGLGAAAGGAAAGAAAGTVAGPVGTVVGAAAGAVAGGLVGKAIAEQIDPTAEDRYWREHYESRPYVGPGAIYDDYGPAYRYGVDAYSRYRGRTFDEARTDLAAAWSRSRGTSRLAWDDAEHAARDAWQRLVDRTDR